MRHEPGAEPFRNADAEQTGKRMAVGLLADSLGGALHRLDMGEQRLAGFGEDLAFASLLEQRLAEPLLQAAQSAPDRGRIDAESHRRPCQLSGTGDRQKILQVVPRNRLHICRSLLHRCLLPAIMRKRTLVYEGERLMRTIDHHIVGHSGGGASRQHEVFDPNTGQVQATVALGSQAELDKAVAAAKAAQPDWARTNPQRRARVMFKYKELIEANMEELAHLLSSEHGKVIADARGDVQRGLEVIEYACGIPQVLKGEYTHGAGPGIDVYSMRQPLGIGAGITPFNFPAMIPMWMFGMAIACGNAFILKPSERDPSVPMRLAELMKEAGLPDGILNVVHGDKEMVDAILDHPDIAAVSFVGSSDIAQYIYSRGTAHNKRVQAFGGAKNHGIVMPDADLDQVVNDLAGAAFGSAGERCMALPVVVPIGEETADRLRDKLIPAIEGLRVGVSTDPEAHYGPVVSKAHKERIENYIQMGIDEGAELVVDGRGFTLQGHEEGFFIGPTFFDRVTPDMKAYKDEIFGPVLQMVRVQDFEEAVRLPSSHEYGNGVAIFTRNGHAAREFTARVNVGMVGVNVPIPVPVSYHSFGGWKRSGFGDIGQYGQEGLRFWTKNKVVTQRWPDGFADADNKQAFMIPTMG